jgi:5-methylthioadenosine/S-adenosylhomocysteine deaminase
MTDTQADLLITNGIVVQLDAQNSILPEAAVAVAGDTIAAVGPVASFRHWRAARVIDAGGGIIMPGLVNTHTHAAMTCFRGLADDLPLMTWLNDHIFPAESKLTEEMVYRGALLACAEMIRSGTTCFCDMYLFEDAVARAARDAGIRAVVGEVLYDFPSPNYGDISQGFTYTEALIEKWRNDPLVTIAVEPHSPYLCAPEVLQRASQISRDHRIPLVIHLAETQSEVASIQKKYNRTPAGLLADLDVLSSRLLACHCVAVSSEDIDLLKDHDVKIAHHAESNMKLASGIAPVPRFVRKELCVALGTDGCASNNNLDLFLEMDTVAKLHKVHTLDPTVLDATRVLRMATIEGARALGLAHRIGSLEPGKAADIIVIDTRQPHLTPMYHPVSHLVYSVNGSDVRHSLINGRVVMENGRFVTLDIERVMADVKTIAAGIRN